MLCEPTLRVTAKAIGTHWGVDSLHVIHDIAAARGPKIAWVNVARKGKSPVANDGDARVELIVGNGYALKAGQLTYDCRYSTMHGMPVTGGRGFRGLKPLWYNSVPP
jgi:hypothetical protein